MEYLLLWHKINLLFKWKRRDLPHISADFDYNSRVFYVTAKVNKILTFPLDNNLGLNQELFHKDIIKRYEQRAKEEVLDSLQSLFINNDYCFLVDDWNSIVLMHSEEY